VHRLPVNLLHKNVHKNLRDVRLSYNRHHLRPTSDNIEKWNFGETALTIRTYRLQTMNVWTCVHNCFNPAKFWALNNNLFSYFAFSWSHFTHWIKFRKEHFRMQNVPRVLWIGLASFVKWCTFVELLSIWNTFIFRCVVFTWVLCLWSVLCQSWASLAHWRCVLTASIESFRCPPLPSSVLKVRISSAFLPFWKSTTNIETFYSL
jgi:hypothetical protein